MSREDNFDPWTQPSVNAELVNQTVQVDTIEGVEPLDGQFGAEVPKIVPDELYETLFGHTEPIPTEIAAAGDDPANVPPMHTYAILDAAKVTNLPDLLEVSGLNHRCLFKGDAFDELKHVAPYLVQLTSDSSFTRNLFTSAGMPSNMWGREAGIYIRSRATLDALWKHLRKFTRLRDDTGKWYYFAFWGRTTMPALNNAGTIDLAEALLNDGSCLGQTWIVISEDEGKATTYRRHPDRHVILTKSPKITPEILAAFDAEVEALKDIKDISAALKQMRYDDEQPSRESLRSSLKALRDVGFVATNKRQQALELFIRASQNGKNKEASEILRKTAQGPGIRLWHLKNLVEGND